LCPHGHITEKLIPILLPGIPPDLVDHFFVIVGFGSENPMAFLLVVFLKMSVTVEFYFSGDSLGKCDTGPILDVMQAKTTDRN